jgi:predicted nucleotidyltransferase
MERYKGEYRKKAVIYMLSQQEILEELAKNLTCWKKQYGVKRIALFGSYVRGEQKDSSDIDVLVEFREDAGTFDNYMDLKCILEDLFQKKVYLVISEDIKPTLKPLILRSAKYA